MKISAYLLVQIGFLTSLGAAYLEDPPTTADSNTVSDCSWWIVASSTDTCTSIASANGISLSDFEQVYNPSVGTACTLNVGQSYCVERNFGIPPVTTTTGTTTSSAPTTTTTGNGVSTPTPSQPGMVSNCAKFDFVNPGDTCAIVASRNGITTTQLSAWNNAGTDCTALQASVYVCVNLLAGSGTVTTTSTSTSTSSTGIVTPTPSQPGMVSNCNKFDFVNPGDTCSVVAARNSISTAQLSTWNNAGTDCTALQASVYVCVGLISTGTTLTTTTTTSSTGIATPTPSQPGMVSNCNKFDFVNPGDTCSAVASRNSITTAQLSSWNSAGADCTALQASVYVCVGVIGGTTPTTTVTTTSTTTSTGNGVSTPTPTQPGMTPNCDKFHFVASGDTCDSIAKAAGITTTQFINWNTGVGSDCTSMWLNAYVCIHAFK
ncbi:hypothetical protein G7054_g5453 [Neopestalotiopsis clavispora]|nr:hypothetical protein G7054_g5453 [Neopestalotiopsis clavispora]